MTLIVSTTALFYWNYLGSLSDFSKLSWVGVSFKKIYFLVQNILICSLLLWLFCFHHNKITLPAQYFKTVYFKTSLPSKISIFCIIPLHQSTVVYSVVSRCCFVFFPKNYLWQDISAVPYRRHFSFYKFCQIAKFVCWFMVFNVVRLF